MIRINDDYVIQVDQYEYCAQCDMHKEDKEGRHLFKTIGHYSNLEGALKGITKYESTKVMSNNNLSLEEALNMIKESNEKFEEYVRKAIGEEDEK